MESLNGVNAITIVFAALCIFAIAYRFYGLWVAQKVLNINAARETPANRFEDGKDYVPTNKYVLFGHHFAAIAAAGPLLGPVLAAQFGYLPGLLWILIGCVLAGIIILIVGPQIKKASPGPIIYSQERIGQNGRRFKFYKIRSMYLDADERKKDLMKENRVSDGLMFKLDFDPRIIGNEILPDGTKKTGIGAFIRNTSLDEFPQFFNVLKGDMSLVGTRPPTVDEWDKYELHHRARMAMKPGITGMWQVSGRSDITDFEQIVKLDTQYICNWSIGLDLKILCQTVSAVLKHKGAM